MLLLFLGHTSTKINKYNFTLGIPWFSLLTIVCIHQEELHNLTPILILNESFHTQRNIIIDEDNHNHEIMCARARVYEILNWIRHSVTDGYNNHLPSSNNNGEGRQRLIESDFVCTSIKKVVEAGRQAGTQVNQAPCNVM